MLQNQNNTSNPMIKSNSTNSFAVKSLLQLPVSLVHKKTRERIFRSWLPVGDSATHDVPGHTPRLNYKATALNPAVLSLKIKFMQRPVLYEVSKLVDVDEKNLTLSGNELQGTCASRRCLSRGRDSSSTCQSCFAQRICSTDFCVNLAFSVWFSTAN